MNEYIEISKEHFDSIDSLLSFSLPSLVHHHNILFYIYSVVVSTIFCLFNFTFFLCFFPRNFLRQIKCQCFFWLSLFSLSSYVSCVFSCSGAHSFICQFRCCFLLLSWCIQSSCGFGCECGWAPKLKTWLDQMIWVCDCCCIINNENSIFYRANYAKQQRERAISAWMNNNNNNNKTGTQNDFNLQAIREFHWSTNRDSGNWNACSISAQMASFKIRC